MTPATQEHPSVEALQRRVEQAERLYAISRRLNATHDPEALLRFIIATAADTLGCEAASILLYDEASAQLGFAAATGSDPEQLAQIPVPLDHSLAGTIFTENRTLIINDVTHDQRHFSEVGEKVSLETRSLVGVPMCIEGQPIGVLEGINKCQGRFTDEDAEVLTIIASQAAVAIRNARQVQALQRANEQLSQLDQLKSDFLALASHELRTPLSVVMGYGTILQEEVHSELTEFTDLLLEAAGQMQRVVETMGQMEALRNETAVMHHRPVSLGLALEVAVDVVRPEAGAREQQLTLHVEQDLPAVRVDAERLHTVFGHVLQNSVRFTPVGGAIDVRAERDGEAVVISVRDTGAGIAPEHIEQIFTEFYQVESHLTRKHGGLGLGLTLARRMIELHGGRMWAESEGLGHGTTVFIRLPLDDVGGAVR